MAPASATRGRLSGSSLVMSRSSFKASARVWDETELSLETKERDVRSFTSICCASGFVGNLGILGSNREGIRRRFGLIDVNSYQVEENGWGRWRWVC